MKKLILLAFACWLPFGAFSQCTTTNATSCVCLDGTSTDCDLLPDIKLGPPPLYDSGNNGVIEYPQLCNPPCSGNDGRLRISVSTPNIGVGPLTVRTTTTFVCGTDTFFGGSPGTCPNGDPPKQLITQRVYHKNGNTMTYYDRAAGSMTYHPSHGHMHVDDWGVYTLRQQTADPNPLNWPIIGTGAKLAFCLMDYGSCSTYNGHCLDASGNIMLNGDFPNWGLGGGQYNCSAVEQGISSGYTDIYYQYLDGMWINIPPGTCNGDYYIVVHIDPYDYFLESDESNQVLAVPYTLTQQVATGTNANIAVAGASTLCPGETTTLTANTGSTYLWSTGETTQNIQAGAGTYTVTVTTPCGVGTSSPVTLTLQNTQAPLMTGDTACVNASGTVSASGSGTINWYDAITGGNFLGTGNTYTVPVATNTITFYADNTDVIVGPTNYAPPHDNAIGGGNNHTDPSRYLIFDAYTAFTLVSVKLYATGAGNRTIELRDANDAVLQFVVVNLPAGESRATLNFNVAPGSNYHLGVGSTPNLFRNNSGVNYPYSIGGFVDITSSSAGSDYYYFFYDWEVKAPDLTCVSSRNPVELFVDPCLSVNENDLNNLVSIYPNPASDNLIVSLQNAVQGSLTVEMLDVDGRVVYADAKTSFSGNYKNKIDLKNIAKGIYVIRVKIDGNEMQKKVTVN